jgi:4-alpha-glucanotransferase
MALRDKFNIPGMLILQFAFDGGDGNPYLPRNHTPNSVVYTGTHDNDTTASWFDGLSDDQREYVYQTIGAQNKIMPLALMECAMHSIARLAVLPMQDILHLGEGHRMNTPGTMTGNWSWRFSWDQLTDLHVHELTEMVHASDRAA